MNQKDPKGISCSNLEKIDSKVTQFVTICKYIQYDSIRHEMPLLGDMIRREVWRVGFDSRNPKLETGNPKPICQLDFGQPKLESRNSKPTNRLDFGQPKPETDLST